MVRNFTTALVAALSVVAGVRQRVAAAVAKHMRMDQEVEAGALADALDQAINCCLLYTSPSPRD